MIYHYSEDSEKGGGSIYDKWLAGTKEVEYRLAALPPTPRKRKTSFKSRASKLGPWQGILNRKFSLHDLNRVLAHVGILKDEAGSVLSKSARKGSWPGVFEALTEMLRIPEIKNKTKLFEAIIFQYGKDATSLSTMRAYNAKNKASLYAYTSVKNLIVDEALKLNLKYHLK